MCQESFCGGSNAFLVVVSGFVILLFLAGTAAGFGPFEKIFQWLWPGETGERSIEIVNRQSYPRVGGNWTVEFVVTGKSDLVVMPAGGTSWKDVKLIEAGCGNKKVPYSLSGGAVLIKDYACGGRGYVISRVLTPGNHRLGFRFGGRLAYALNKAACSPKCDTNVFVEGGTYTFDTDIKSAEIPLSVTYNTSKAFIIGRHTGGIDSSQSGNSFTSVVRFVDGSKINVTRYTTSLKKANVSWFVVSADNINVWNGTTLWGTSDGEINESLSPSLPSNYTGKCFVELNTRVKDTAFTNVVDGKVMANITNATNLNLKRSKEEASFAEAETAWFVVCFMDNTTVQSGYMSGTGTLTDTINAVNLSNSYITFTYMVSGTNNNGIGQVSPRCNVSTSTQVECSRQVTTGTLEVQYSVISFEEGNGGLVQQGYMDLIETDLTQQASLGSAVNRSRSFVWHSNDHSGTGTAFPRPMFISYFIDDSTIEVRRSRSGAAGQVHEHNWQVITWPDKTSLETGNLPPSIVLNSPANGSKFTSIGSIILNVTVTDEEGDNMTVKIYGSNDTNPDKEALLYINNSVPNSSTITYNWTAPLTDSSDPDLMLLFHFDGNSDFGENTTHVYDFSGNGNNGTIPSSGPQLKITSKFGRSWFFGPDIDIVNGYVEVSDSPTIRFNTSFSITAWVYSTSSGGTHIITKKGATDINYNCRVGGLTQKLKFTVEVASGTKTTTAAGAFPTNEWVHIACVYNGTDIMVYENGVQTGTPVSVGETILTSSEVMHVGDNTAGASVWGGYIDEFALWNRSLTAAEIKALYDLNADTYYWYANVSDSDGETKSGTSNFTVSASMVVSLASPAANTNVVQNTTFTVNATVFCRTGSCGNVNGTLRYNASSPYPDTNISETFGAQPFHITDYMNPQACPGNPLQEDEYCNLTWTVNATGSLDSVYKIGVFFFSGLADVPDNHTDNVTATIVECIIDFVLQFSSVDFGTGGVNQQLSAAGNNNQTYNLTVGEDTTCNVDIYIKGDDLLHTTDSSYKIGAGNLTWTNVTNESSFGVPLAKTFSIVNSSVTGSTNTTLYFWLDIPQGMLNGPYNSTVTFSAVKEGGVP
jgi:hypothetical protein